LKSSKKITINIILIASAANAVISLFTKKEIFQFTLFGLLAAFLLYALWPTPRKHKNISYADHEDAIYRGIGGPPDLPLPKQSKSKRKRQ